MLKDFKGVKIYKYITVGKWFVFCDGWEPLQTPRGNMLRTLYKPLADRILYDINKNGYNSHAPHSIFRWHIIMLDFFLPVKHQYGETLFEEFFNKGDWTCQTDNGMEWRNFFGKWEERSHQIRKWLSKASKMQMAAAFCIGDAFDSLNLAFSLAAIMERYTEEKREKAFQNLASLLEEKTNFGPAAAIMDLFRTFELYYGIHLHEDGPILESIISNEEDVLLFIEKTMDNSFKEIAAWRNREGKIACPGKMCPAKCNDLCPIWLNTKGLSMAKIGDFHKAIETYLEVLKLAPDMPNLWINMALCYGNTNQYQKALDSYQKAYELAGRKDALFGMALSSKKLGKIEESLSYCKEYKRKYGDNALAGVERELIDKLNLNTE